MNDKGVRNRSAKKVLVVEDDQDNREMVIKILKHNGYQPIEAVNGREAMAKARTENPDLILLDLYIPKMDGYEVTKRLKADQGLNHIPIIALTAHAMKGDREEALAAGFDGYIAKPINVRELPQQIEHFLGTVP
ncbi:MAG: response regulator [Thermodesulfobacteriota bacterium]